MMIMRMMIMKILRLVTLFPMREALTKLIGTNMVILDFMIIR